jgi:tRNA (guanosine-2'-O-)-methyltransferase
MRQLDSTGMKRLHREWRRRTDRRVALILDGVTTSFNVGGILRTAAALRVAHIWLVGATEPTNPKVRRTALGAERYLTWSEMTTFSKAATAAHDDGFVVVALELAADAVPLHELDVEGDVCIAVGHEDHGLSPRSLEACDHVAYIPQVGRIGSLNVATATSIALYEIRRREWERPS